MNVNNEHNILNSVFMRVGSIDISRNLYTKLMNAYTEYITLLGEYTKLNGSSNTDFTEELVQTMKKKIFYKFDILSADMKEYKSAAENPGLTFKLTDYPIRVNSTKEILFNSKGDKSSKRGLDYLWITPPVFSYAVDIVGPTIVLKNTTMVPALNDTFNYAVSDTFNENYHVFRLPSEHIKKTLYYQFIGEIINHNHINSVHSSSIGKRPVGGYNAMSSVYLNNAGVCLGTHTWKNEFSSFVRGDDTVGGFDRVNPIPFTARFLYDLMDWVMTCTYNDCYIYKYITVELTRDEYINKFINFVNETGKNVQVTTSIFDEVTDWCASDADFYTYIMKEVYEEIKELGKYYELSEQGPYNEHDEESIRNALRKEWMDFRKNTVFDTIYNYVTGQEGILHPGLLTSIVLFNAMQYKVLLKSIRDESQSIISLLSQILMALLGDFILMEEFSNRAKRFPNFNNTNNYTQYSMNDTLAGSAIFGFMNISRKTYNTQMYSLQDINYIQDIYNYYMSL